MEMQYKGDGIWTPCFDIPNIKVPAVAYLGFSAETGELSDNHDIISVETKNLYNAPPADDKGKGGIAQPANTKQKGKGYDPNRGQGAGWGWFFVKFLLAGLLLAGAYVALTMYRASRRSSRF